MTQVHGISEDEDLLACYPGIRQDLEDLKIEGWINELSQTKLEDIKRRQTGAAVEPMAPDEERKERNI